MTSTLGDSKDGRFQGHCAELLKVEGKHALREPAGLAMGIGFPIILLVIFGLIGIAVPGNVAGTGHTVLDIYVPVIMVVGLFSLGLVVAALAPSQTIASALSGGLFFLSLFLSGLWIQPATVGGPLATIMYYSPSGAAAQALLYSVFNAAPPVTAVVTMVVYTGFFAFIATRYFRWE